MCAAAAAGVAAGLPCAGAGAAPPGLLEIIRSALPAPPAATLVLVLVLVTTRVLPAGEAPPAAASNGAEPLVKEPLQEPLLPSVKEPLHDEPPPACCGCIIGVPKA